MPKSKLFTSVSAEVAEESLDSSVPRLVSAPAPSKIGSPPAYSAPKFVSENTTVAAGRLPEEIYTSTLPLWRASLRRQCLAVVEWETGVIAQLQVRSPFLPSYLGLEQEITDPGTLSTAGHFFCSHIHARHTYLLSRLSPSVFLLRTSRTWERVRI